MNTHDMHRTNTNDSEIIMHRTNTHDRKRACYQPNLPPPVNCATAFKIFPPSYRNNQPFASVCNLFYVIYNILHFFAIFAFLYEAAETGRSSRELPSYWPCKHDRLATSNREGGSKELE